MTTAASCKRLRIVASESLTDLQLSVMKAVWQIGEGSVAEIAAQLAAEGKDLAPTTVATLLQRLAKQGWVKHRKNGRQFLYRASVKQAEAARSVLKRVLTSFFGGKVSMLTAQLLETETISPEELKELRKLIKGKGG